MIRWGTYPQNPTFECIAVRHRREILRTLNTRRLPLTEQRLAESLVAATRKTSSLEGSTTTKMRMELTHVHLPALESAGLVTWKEAEGTVDLAPHPALSDPRFGRLLEIQLTGLDEVLSMLSHDYRRIVLTVLEDERTPLSRSQLTHRIRQMAPETPELSIPGEDTINTSLHHVHLPKLDDEGFINYTPETAEVAFIGHATLEEVLSIVYEREESTVDRLDGFFDGLGESYRQIRRGTHDELTWPHFWRDASRG